MKKIQEIRIGASGKDEPLATMGGNIGGLFLYYMGNYSMGNKVNILVIDMSIEPKEEIILHNKNIYNLYFIDCRVCDSVYNGLSNFEKLEYTCRMIYKSLLVWAERYSLPQKPIEEAYQKIIESEYFSESNKKFHSKNRRYCCYTECRYEHEFITYRLIFLNKKTKVIKRYFICEIKHCRNDDNRIDIHQFLDIVNKFSFKIRGWINNEEFEMYWGEQEKYIFNAENETIKTITNNAD